MRSAHDCAIPLTVHGVDFSGAADAGRKIWISSGTIADGRLQVVETRPAAELPEGSQGRDAALAALRQFLQAAADCAIGLDFPFGLPRPLVSETSWVDFALAFPGRYRSADEFRARCRALSTGEQRRVTDREACTPWAAWNWRLYRQTYFGIGAVLAPLIKDAKVRVLPMQAPDGQLPWLLEICPASTLRRLGLRRLPYKRGSALDSRRARAQILERLTHGDSLVLERTIFERAIEDPRGDALDSILAAYAVFEVITSNRLLPSGEDYRLEGHVYF